MRRKIIYIFHKNFKNQLLMFNSHYKIKKFNNDSFLCMIDECFNIKKNYFKFKIYTNFAFKIIKIKNYKMFFKK
jgi:hypothetical protein